MILCDTDDEGGGIAGSAGCAGRTKMNYKAKGLIVCVLLLLMPF